VEIQERPTLARVGVDAGEFIRGVQADRARGVRRAGAAFWLELAQSERGLRAYIEAPAAGWLPFTDPKSHDTMHVRLLARDAAHGWIVVHDHNILFVGAEPPVSGNVVRQDTDLEAAVRDLERAGAVFLHRFLRPDGTVDLLQLEALAMPDPGPPPMEGELHGDS